MIIRAWRLVSHWRWSGGVAEERSGRVIVDKQGSFSSQGDSWFSSLLVCLLIHLCLNSSPLPRFALSSRAPFTELRCVAPLLRLCVAPLLWCSLVVTLKGSGGYLFCQIYCLTLLMVMSFATVYWRCFLAMSFGAVCI